MRVAQVELREKAIKKAQEMHALNQVQKAEIDALKIEVTVLQAEVEVLKPKSPPPVVACTKSSSRIPENTQPGAERKKES